MPLFDNSKLLGSALARGEDDFSVDTVASGIERYQPFVPCMATHNGVDSSAILISLDNAKSNSGLIAPVDRETSDREEPDPHGLGLVDRQIGCCDMILVGFERQAG